MKSAVGPEAAVFFRLLRTEEKGEELREAVHALGESVPDSRVHLVDQGTFTILPGAPFAYWVSDSVRQLFGKLRTFEGEGGTVKAGLCTGNDFRFIRAMWEIEPKLGLPPNGRGGWVPFAKGGEYSRYFGDIHLTVDWRGEGQDMAKECIGARVQNVDFYFRPGLTWTLRTTSRFSIRALPAGCIFGHKGPAIFSEPSRLARILALFSSRVIEALISIHLGAGEAAARSYEVGLVQKVPIPDISHNVGDRLTQLASRSHDLTQQMMTFDEVSQVFVAPALSGSGPDLRMCFLSYLHRVERTQVELLEGSAEIDTLVFDLYGISDEDRARLDHELGPRPGTLLRDPAAVDDETFRRSYLAKQEVVTGEGEEDEGEEAERPPRRWGKAFPSLESLSLRFRVHPAVLASKRQALGLFREEELAEAVQDLLMYAVGCAFGRWDLRIALDRSRAPSLPDTFDPLPLTSPGRLVGPEGLPAGPSDIPDDYPLPITWDGILADDEGCRRKDGNPGDLVAMVGQVMAILHPGRPEAIEAEVVRVLGVRDLRAYFRTKFFAFHLGRYSKSRRKAPIYWPLQSDRKSYGLWLYAPRVTADTLFVALREYVDPKILHEEMRLKEMRRTKEASDLPRRDQAKLDKEIDRQEDFLGELGRLKTALTNVTALGYAPNPDDGVIINAAPLYELLILWPDAKRMWQELLSGKHSWSAMSAYLRGKGLI